MGRKKQGYPSPSPPPASAVKTYPLVDPVLEAEQERVAALIRDAPDKTRIVIAPDIILSIFPSPFPDPPSGQR